MTQHCSALHCTTLYCTAPVEFQLIDPLLEKVVQGKGIFLPGQDIPHLQGGLFHNIGENPRGYQPDGLSEGGVLGHQDVGQLAFDWMGADWIR